MAREISAGQLAQAIAQGQQLRLLDVRQPWESRIAHLPGSLLIPLGELPKRAGELGSDLTAFIIVYCHHGVRSQSAAAYLERLGFTNVYSLAGGIDAWSCEVDPAVPRY
ncbi:MAG: rhodanese-like domain-containing protein [Gemmataceae bacterium]|nr:rhodanese-like domain-containing protein [Gemmataceae bacterium]